MDHRFSLDVGQFWRRAFAGPLGLNESHARAADLFSRAIATVYFVAFVSLGVQVIGLLGKNGILPAATYLNQLQQDYGVGIWKSCPTLLWFNASDATLQVLCWSGAVSSLLAAAGIFQGPLLYLNWIFYGSLVAAGQDFLSFQWDALLLEAGFLAPLLASWRPLASWTHPKEPSVVMVWLVRWLVFRLMFSSGWVKIRADEAWRNLSALDFHYWTQPLPTWTAWWMHQGPEWTHQAGVLVTLGIELFAPWLIFFGRRARLAAFGLLSGFQILLLLTGNFGFFNLLSLALCVMLLSSRNVGNGEWEPEGQAAGEGRLEANIPGRTAFLSANYGRWARNGSTFALAALILALSSGPVLRLFSPRAILPYPFDAGERELDGFRLVNAYGLFANMTQDRPEIILEASHDGSNWTELEFRWKPGDLRSRPRFTFFHMPRLDWQLWFEGLYFLRQKDWFDARGIPPERRRYEPDAWFLQFVGKILLRDPAVLELLGKNRLPDGNFYIRARVFRYRFTNPHVLHSEGRWWNRESMGVYLPRVHLKPEKSRL